VVEEAVVEEAVVAEDVVGDEDAAIFITTAKAVVKTTFAKPEAAAIKLGKTTAAKPAEATVAKLGKTTVVKVVKPGVAIELIETTAAACRLC
jgi:hypothetical protein